MDPPAIVSLSQSRAWRALVEPVVRHAGRFGFFLVLAPDRAATGFSSWL
jgi:hypothetical protein